MVPVAVFFLSGVIPKPNLIFQSGEIAGSLVGVYPQNDC